MAEYIKKWPVVDKLTTLENEFQQYKPFRPCEATMYRRICDIEIEIGKMDAEDVAPVRHGRWNRPYISWFLPIKIKNPHCFCTNCAYPMKHKRVTRYCPNCGARMDLEEPNETKEP